MLLVHLIVISCFPSTSSNETKSKVTFLTLAGLFVLLFFSPHPTIEINKKTTSNTAVIIFVFFIFKHLLCNIEKETVS
ncbi:MAG: hypothetical protein E7388_01890 [Ruminococcaceae bacterium]|nr:hypothetical protein [Oscillospiraceae bacterium]